MTYRTTSSSGSRRRRAAAKKIRWGEQFVHLILFIAAAISVLTTVGIVVSLLLPAIDFFREVSPWEFFTGTTWAPLFLDGAVRRRAARRRHVHDLVLVGARRVPARGRRRDLPERVREPARRRRPEADPRDPRRDPDGRPRLLRPHVRDAAPARHRGPGRDLQRALGEPRARGHADPDDRVALRGRDGRGAARPPRRRLRARRRQAAGVDAHRRPGRDLGDHRRVRARRSRAPSARR